MTRLWFVVPVHGREALARVCLKQLRRTCDALAPDIDATAVVIGEGKLITFAKTLGFATVTRDNDLLGRKFNDGYQLACDPEYNPEPADYVVPCGSDDWIDPAIFQHLPVNKIGVFRQIAVVNEERTEIARLRVLFPGGAGIRIIPRRFIELANYRPAEEDRKRACDMSTWNGIYRALNQHEPPSVYLDVHPFQIVDWKSHRNQLNPYTGLVQRHRRGPVEDPFDALADVYPEEALEEMRSL